MEDDLAGAFASPEDPPPLLRGGELSLGRLGSERLVICPLVMDFGAGGAGLSLSGSYYRRAPAKPVEVQVRDLMAGIRDYRRARPEGFLEIRPFLGVDTRRREAGALAAWLEDSFAHWTRGQAASWAAFAAMADYEDCDSLAGRYAGVKVYPPLGFDPWPQEGEERDKVELLWAFCEARGIPVTTHCDDQGFRVTGLEDSWRRSSPERWRPVLERHPRLRLDFAHFGMQWSHPLGRPPLTEWTETILGYMSELPHVYADFSFNGTESSYYEWLDRFLDRAGRAARERWTSRILFGSDFLVNLSRVRSYSDYFRIFADSPFGDEERRLFCRDNPERFLFGD
jgi:hypothetical protein